MQSMTSTWHESADVAIEVEDTEVGREVSIHERQDGEWNRQYTMPAGQARELSSILDEIFPE